MTNIAIDLGYSFTQAIRDQKRVIFPTVYGEVSRSQLDLFGTQNGLDITTSDGGWMLGETALLQSVNASHPLADDWFTTPQYKALVLAAISELYAPSTHQIEVTVWTGLPYQFHSQRDTLKKNLVGLHRIERYNRPPQTIAVKDVKCYVQNFAPVLYHWSRLSEYAGHYVGCLNIGGNTIELATGQITPSGITPIHNQCRTEFKGVLSVIEPVRKRLEEQFHGEKWDDSEVINILKSGQLERYGKRYDVSKLTSVVLENYQEMVENLISNVWSKQQPIPISRLSALVLSGGGAHLVKLDHPHLVVSNDPQWDTVEGYLKLSRMVK